MQEIPSHIAIIPDGNRRWAQQNGVPALIGHKKGFERTVDIVKHALKAEIKVLTFYAFSTENWDRSKSEVDYLMELFNLFFDRYLEKFNKWGCQIRHLGNFESLSEKSIGKIKNAVEVTKNNDKMIFQLALNYGGRDELKRAIQKILAEKIEPKDLTEEKISSFLDTAGVPDPDIIVRTSGEQRLSGFLLWQSAYSELYFSKKYWPDFTGADLDEVIKEHQARQRRFGK